MNALSTHEEADGGGEDDLEPNPLAHCAGGVEHGEEPEADEREAPREDVRPAVLLHDLDKRTCDEREGSDDERGRKALNAGAEWGRAHACLEVDWEVNYKDEEVSHWECKNRTTRLQNSAELVIP